LLKNEQISNDAFFSVQILFDSVLTSVQKAEQKYLSELKLSRVLADLFFPSEALKVSQRAFALFGSTTHSRGRGEGVTADLLPPTITLPLIPPPQKKSCFLPAMVVFGV
jgi:hypothetical protein